MIAYNKEKYSKIGNKHTWKSDYNKDLPDYLDICLKETSDNGNKHNEIMIAYNKEKYSKIGNKHTWKSDYNKDLPDYLDICLKDNYGHTFMVVGTRILVNYYDYKDANSLNKEMKARARQGKKIVDRINELNEKNYKMNLMKKIIKLLVVEILTSVEEIIKMSIGIDLFLRKN